MKYRVIHTTELIYDTQVGLCHNEARLQPHELPHQKVFSSELQIEPVPHDYYERLDYFGNRTAYFSIHQPHDQLTVTAVSEVEVVAPGLLDNAAGPTRETGLFDNPESLSWESVRERLRSEHSDEIIAATQFTFDSPMVSADELLADYARPSFAPGKPLDEAVHDLMQRIYREFTYDPEFSSIATPLKEVMKHRSGVCQDFAHLGIGCLRSQGLAARYVSGYIETEPPAGKERLVGADASHAWFSVFAPDYGWLDFDPTNNRIPGEQHITLAWGRDYADVTPLKGVVFGGGKHVLKVAVDVQRIG
jgi:transglutaminase-like putative cysteine protease